MNSCPYKVTCPTSLKNIIFTCTNNSNKENLEKIMKWLQIPSKEWKLASLFTRLSDDHTRKKKITLQDLWSNFIGNRRIPLTGIMIWLSSKLAITRLFYLESRKTTFWVSLLSKEEISRFDEYSYKRKHITMWAKERLNY